MRHYQKKPYVYLFIIALIVICVCQNYEYTIFRILKISNNNKFTSDSAPIIQNKAINSYKIIQSDISFGEKQINNMLHDRHIMNKYILKGDPVWNWCVKHFAGKEGEHPVVWCPDPPASDNFTCDFMPAYKTHLAFIRIRNRQQNRGEQLWADTIYELNNSLNSSQFSKLDRLACEGKLSKKKWIVDILRLEYDAMRRTRSFYQKIWQPLMQSRGIPTKPYIYRWGVSLPNTFEGWLAEISDDPNIYVKHYGRIYDENILPYIIKYR